MQLLFWILDGLAAGWLTGQIISRDGRHWVVDIAMGVAGAVTGGFIASALGSVVRGRMIYTNLAAVAGAVILTALARLVGGRREYASTD